MKVFKILFFILSVSLFAQTNSDELLLNDFRPQNIYNIPKSKIEKAKFPVIDMHSHPYVNSEEELDLLGEEYG